MRDHSSSLLNASVRVPVRVSNVKLPAITIKLVYTSRYIRSLCLWLVHSNRIITKDNVFLFDRLAFNTIAFQSRTIEIYLNGPKTTVSTPDNPRPKECDRYTLVQQHRASTVSTALSGLSVKI